MNKKAQSGMIAVIFLLIIFIINWAIWLGKVIADYGTTIVQEQGITGIEAFAFENLNLIIFFALMLGAMAYFYFGSRA